MKIMRSGSFFTRSLRVGFGIAPTGRISSIISANLKKCPSAELIIDMLADLLFVHLTMTSRLNIRIVKDKNKISYIKM
jgi:hypothetical protein